MTASRGGGASTPLALDYGCVLHVRAMVAHLAYARDADELSQHSWSDAD